MIFNFDLKCDHQVLLMIILLMIKDNYLFYFFYRINSQKKPGGRMSSTRMRNLLAKMKWEKPALEEIRLRCGL